MPEPTEHPATTEARRLMAASEEHRNAGGLASLLEAEQDARRAIDLLESHPDAQQPLVKRLLEGALMLAGHAEREQGTAAKCQNAASAYERARTIFLTVMDSGSPDDQNELASAWIHQGMSLAVVGGAEALREAVACFDRSLEIRRALPLQENWLYRWALAASWMNRADACTRIGSDADLSEAERSYDEAIGQLKLIPMEDRPGVRNRCAVAWMNRGISLQVVRSTNRLSDALTSFENAIALLRQPPTNLAYAELRRTLACALVNYAAGLLTSEPPTMLPARVAAQEALALVSGEEESDPLAAEVGLKARHALCVALSTLLDAAPPDENAPAEDWITTTTDAVDEAMNIARHWEAQGVTQFRPIVSSLFRYGSYVYVTRQPHFLAEYLLDHLDPERTPGALANEPEMHRAAQEAIWRTVESLQRYQQWASHPETSPSPERVASALQILGELQETDHRLAEIRQKYLADPDAAVAQQNPS